MTAVLESRPSGPDLAIRSRASVRDGLRRMPTRYLAVLAAYLLLVAANFYADKFSIEEIHLPDGHVLPAVLQGAYLIFSGLFDWFFSSFLLAIAAVAMHRFILLGEVGGAAMAPHSLYVRRFFCALLVVEVLVALPLLAGFVLSRLVPSLSIPFSLIGFLAGLFIFIRSTMVFPATAIGDFQGNLIKRIDASWRQMEGQFWLFISGVICVAWPLILFLFSLVLFDAVGFLTGIAHWPHFRNTLPFKLLDDGLIQFAVFVLDVGLASWLYAWVRPKNDGSIS